jgi:hypothetical protein
MHVRMPDLPRFGVVGSGGSGDDGSDAVVGAEVEDAVGTRP